MVTTTTSPRRARLVPSVSGEDPDPVANPPPWHQNITGRLRPSLIAGVHTLSTRQSSPSAGRFRPATPSAPSGGGAAAGSRWGALCPNSSASRTAVHFSGSFGGRNRFVPAVLAPYGIPLKVLMPWLSTPRTFPKLVSATTYLASCASNTRLATAAAEALRKKSRRLIPMVAPPREILSKKGDRRIFGLARARIARRRRRVVFPPWRAEQFGENRLQRVRPHLVTLESRMQPVAGVHHAGEQAAFAIR